NSSPVQRRAASRSASLIVSPFFSAILTKARYSFASSMVWTTFRCMRLPPSVKCPPNVNAPEDARTANPHAGFRHMKRAMHVRTVQKGASPKIPQRSRRAGAMAKEEDAQRIAKNYVRRLARDITIHQAILTGSRATGSYLEDSDVDLII